jgi:hypothetical protein
VSLVPSVRPHLSEECLLSKHTTEIHPLGKACGDGSTAARAQLPASIETSEDSDVSVYSRETEVERGHVASWKEQDWRVNLSSDTRHSSVLVFSSMKH